MTSLGVGHQENRTYGNAGVRNNATGVFAPVLAKHSKSFSLIDCVSVGDRMQRNFAPMRKQVEAWQKCELADFTAKVVIYEAFVEGKLEGPKHLAILYMTCILNRYAFESVTALMQSVLLRGAAQRIKHPIPIPR